MCLVRGCAVKINRERSADLSNKEQVLKRLKIAIIILLIVFIVSFVALAVRIIYECFFTDSKTTVVVPDNMIDLGDDSDGIPGQASNNSQNIYLGTNSALATVVKLHSDKTADNDAFSAENMLPGDTVTKYYCLKVYHKADAAVYFKVTDIEQTNALGDILNIKVTRLDDTSPQLLCNDTFANVEGKIYNTVFSVNDTQETVAFYQIDVSLPTSAGNEYQGATLSASFNWYAENPDPVHICENKCPECGLCLDTECTDPVCADKCQGHTPPHECEHICPECGKCTDASCNESVCADKCQGHTPPHECEHKCPECGKCTDASCNESVCADKCQGHTIAPLPHKCESVCLVCGKCLDTECTDPACAEKCPGHTPAPHICESKCPECGKCLDKSCESSACSDKCQCSPLAPEPTGSNKLLPWLIVPLMSLIPLIFLLVMFFNKKKEEDDEK